MSLRFYHNPRCSKSREALALLRDRGAEPEVVEYLKTPPDEAELRAVLAKLGIAPRDLMRKKEAAEAGLDDPALDDDALVRGMVVHPKVIERPILVTDAAARLGRPPERVLEIL